MQSVPVRLPDEPQKLPEQILGVRFADTLELREQITEEQLKCQVPRCRRVPVGDKFPGECGHVNKDSGPDVFYRRQPIKAAEDTLNLLRLFGGHACQLASPQLCEHVTPRGRDLDERESSHKCK